MTADTPTMPAGCTQNTGQKAAEPRSNAGGVSFLSSLFQVDGRSRLGRRINELRELFTNALGGEAALTPVQAMKIGDAAERQALAEFARGRFLQGAVSLDDVVRAERLAIATVKDLGLDGAKAGQRPTLADYLLQKGAGA